MTHALTIATREIRERKMIFAAAALIATMPFLFSLLPWTASYGHSARIVATGTVISFCWVIAVSGLLGASLISRELAERRLSFYLTKPVSAASVWFGKLLAAVVLILVPFAIVLVPSLIAGWNAWGTTFSGRPQDAIAAVVVSSLALLLLLHAISTSLRSRSPLIVVDLLLTAALVGATSLIANPLVKRLSIANASIVGWIVATGIVLSILPGGLYQITRGRSDIRASHAALSKFTWVSSIVLLLAAGGFVVWVLSATPNDLENVHGGQAGTGNWAWVSGKAKNRNDYKPLFVTNVASGIHYALPGTTAAFQPVFSRDGSTLLWSRFLARGNRGHILELMVTRLNGSARHQPAGYSAQRVAAAVLSDDGKRLAAIDQKTLSVVDIDTQRLLASARLPEAGRQSAYQLYFADADTLRIFEHVGSSEPKAVPVRMLRVHEFSIPQRRLTTTGELKRESRWLAPRASSDGGRILVWSGPKQTEIVDGRTLATLGTLPSPSGWYQSLVVSGRNSVLLPRRENGRELQVFGPDGSLARSVPLGATKHGFLMGEVAPMKVAVLMTTGNYVTGVKDNRIVIVDCARGVVERELRGFIPFEMTVGDDPRSALPDASRPMLVLDAQNRFWRWNPLTGDKSKLES